LINNDRDCNTVAQTSANTAPRHRAAT